MKRIGYCLSLLAVLGLMSPADAGCNVYPTFYPSHAAHHVNVKKFTALEFVQPYFVGVAPAYLAPAQPPAAAAHTTPCDEKVKALDAKIAALEAKLASGTGGGQPAPQMLPQTTPKALPTLTGKCMNCHDATTAAAKGKGVVLFEDGVVKPWSAEMTGKVFREVSSGRMPRGGKLSEAEFAALAQELFDLTSK